MPILRLLTSACAALLIAGVSPAAAVVETPESELTVSVPTAEPCAGGSAVTRVAGSDRYGTSAAVAAAWPAGQAVVFVVSGQTYPDAVSAAGRAGDVNAPVLLAMRDSIPAPTAQALRRLEPDRIVVVGGTAAVSAQVARSLGSYAERPVERVSGSDRYATSAALAAKYGRGQSKVFLASGQDFPDALTGSALAGHLEVPLLLTRGDRLEPSTAARLRTLAAREVVVLGSSGAVSSAVAKQAASYSTTGRWSRLAGADRYATAEAIARQFPRGASTGFVASGQQFPDALVGAALAGRRGVPMVLTPRTGLAAGTRRALEHQRPDAISVLGGAAVISSATVTALGRYARTPSGSCRPLLGGYLGSAQESPDQRFKASFGAYPDLASTYYQASGRKGGKLNFDYERARIQRGTIPVLTVTSRKGPWTMGQIASGAADGWIDSWARDLAALDSEVWFTFDHEFEVKLNQGQFPKDTTMDQYVRAYNRFQSRVQAGAPKVRFLYWYGYSDTAKIDKIGKAVSRPDIIALDPYVFKHRPASTTFEQMAQPKVQWLRGRSWYAGQPIVFAEFAKDTRFGDANVAAFLSDLRPSLADLGVSGAIYFARDKSGAGDIRAEITATAWPRARAAYRASVLQ